MTFRMTSNVKVKKDKNGAVRQLRHPRQAYSAVSSADAAVPQSRRELADRYLREVLPVFELEPDLALDLAGAIDDKLKTGEGSRLRFQKEKVLRDRATVSYAQTYHGIPVWEAGLTVQMRGDAVTGSQSSVQRDMDLDPPSEDARFWPESIDEATLARLLGLADAPDLRINGRRILVYRYEAENRGACGADPDDLSDESQAHVPQPRLDPPPVPDSIRSGRDYIVGDVQFTLSHGGWPDVNWSAFIEPQTGAVLFLRAFTSCVDGFVYLRDPLTATGNRAIRPSSSSEVLNGVRDRVELPGLEPASGGRRELVGEFVRLVDLSAPHSAPPTEATPANFLYAVPTDDFAAVNAYYHCDRLFRMMEQMGFDVRSFFDGTTFPVRVDHRATIGGETNTVNAQAPGNTAGNGSDGFRFALVERDTGVGMAVDWRVVLHEFGHTILWDNVNSPNFFFSHSAGDSLAAILNDAETEAPDRGRTFPWTPITRRHDRSITSGFAWGGSRDSRFRVGDRRSRDVAGYDREQILSSTLFRLYRAIGGEHAELELRRFAARFVAFLVFDSIGALSPFAQPADAEELAEALMDSDLGTTDFEGQPGGVVHKVIRWAFEQQGAYQPAGAPTPVISAGAPPAIDVFIDDGRGGDYTPGVAFATDSTEVWTRKAEDGGTGHQRPVGGATSFVYARVGNRGSETARQVKLRLFATDNPIDPVWPEDWQPVGDIDGDTIAAGAEAIVGPVEWTPTGPGERSLLASVSATGDASNIDVVVGATATARLAHCDNNIALRKVTVENPVGDEGDLTVDDEPGLSIPDRDPVGVTTTLVFPKAGEIARVAVALDIRHTFIGDLVVKLKSPSGTEVLLHDKAGGSAEDLIKTFSSETDSPLAALRGEQAEGLWELQVADLVGQDTGTLRRWSVTIGIEESESRIQRDSSPALAIPDANPAGVRDTIRIDRTGDLRAIAVPLRLRHTFIGDLRVTLRSPSGTVVVLHDRAGGSTHDIITTFTRDELPALAAVQGEPVRGDWELEIADLVGADTGTLESWGIDIVLGPTAPTLARGESAPSLAIPDANPAGVADAIDIDAAGTIASTRVDVEIRHTFVGDLRVALTSPVGSEIVLHSQSGGSAHDLVRTYSSDDFTPLQELSNEPGQGRWLLSVADLVGQDTGLLVRWRLELTYVI